LFTDEVLYFKASVEPKFCPVKNCPKITVWGKWGEKVIFRFRNPQKGTSLRETTPFDVLDVKVGVTALL